jgi:hypothetical protein
LEIARKTKGKKTKKNKEKQRGKNKGEKQRGKNKGKTKGTFRFISARFFLTRSLGPR